MPKIHCLQCFLPINHFIIYSEILVLRYLWHWLFGVRKIGKYPLNIFSLNRDLDREMGKVVWVACCGCCGKNLKV